MKRLLAILAVTLLAGPAPLLAQVETGERVPDALLERATRNNWKIRAVLAADDTLTGRVRGYRGRYELAGVDVATLDVIALDRLRDSGGSGVIGATIGGIASGLIFFGPIGMDDRPTAPGAAILAAMFTGAGAVVGYFAGKAVGPGGTRTVPLWSYRKAIDQDELAVRILSADARVRREAVSELVTIEPQQLSPRLRDAAIQALQQEGDRYRGRAAQDRAGARIDFVDERTDALGDLMRIVAALNDPRTVRAQASVLGDGFAVVYGLASLGEYSVPNLLETVSDTAAPHEAKSHALVIMRLLLEAERPAYPLSDRSREAIRAYVRNVLLSTGQHFMVYWYAIDVAIVDGDAGLRDIVASMARDADVLAAKGIVEPEIIALMQEHARERLSGQPSPMRRR